LIEFLKLKNHLNKSKCGQLESRLMQGGRRPFVTLVHRSVFIWGIAHPLFKQSAEMLRVFET
jgi:hypothetical protein